MPRNLAKKQTNSAESLDISAVGGSADYSPAQADPLLQANAPRVQLPRFYTYAEIAEAFGRKPRTIRLWVAAGRLQAARIGGARLVSEAELERFTDKITAQENGFESSPAATLPSSKRVNP